MGPVFVSVVVHAVLLGLVAVVTVRVASVEDRRVRQLGDIGLEAPPEASSSSSSSVDPEAALRGGAGGGAAEVDAAAVLARGLAPNGGESFALPESSGDAALAVPEAVRLDAASAPAVTASFAGMQTRAAGSVVFVVDASGSMTTSLSLVAARLSQTLEALSPVQRVQVLAVREGEVQALIGDGGLVRATPAAVQEAQRSLGRLRAGGRADPVAGLRAALALRPEGVFLLTRMIQRTGPGAPEALQPRAVLAQLDAANPRRGRDGARPVVIKTVQFIDPDPTGLLEGIARLHGDGPGSHRVLTIEDLAALPEAGAGGAEIDDPQVTAALREARAALDAISGTGADAAVLFGVATVEQRRAAAAAAERALGALAPLDAAQLRGVGFVHGRALALRASADRYPAGPSVAAAAVLVSVTLASPDAEVLRLATLAAVADGAVRADAIGSLRSLVADGVPLGDAARAVGAAAAVSVGGEAPWAVTSEGGVALLLAEAEARAVLRRDGGSWEAASPLLAGRPGLGAGLRAACDMKLATLAAGLMPSRAASLPESVRLSEAVRSLEAGGAARALAIVDAVIEGGGGLDDGLARVGAAAASRLDRAGGGEAALLGFARRAVGALGAGETRRALLSTRLAGEGRLAEAEGSRERLSDALREALRLEPGHPDADRWRTLLAGLALEDGRLLGAISLAAAVPAGSAESERASRVVLAAASRGVWNAAVLDAALRYAEARGLEQTAALRELLGRALVETDPQRSVALLEAEIEGASAGTRLALARALMGVGRAEDAFAQLRVLADGVEPGSEAYWRVWTELLAHLADRAAAGDDTARREAVAHLARLELLDGALGGAETGARLAAIRSRLRRMAPDDEDSDEGAGGAGARR